MSKPRMKEDEMLVTLQLSHKELSILIAATQAWLTQEFERANLPPSIEADNEHTTADVHRLAFLLGRLRGAYEFISNSPTTER